MTTTRATRTTKKVAVFLLRVALLTSVVIRESSAFSSPAKIPKSSSSSTDRSPDISLSLDGRRDDVVDRSRLSRVVSEGLVDVSGSSFDEAAELVFPPDARLIAVTGETGGGKSRLLTTALGWLSGERVGAGASRGARARVLVEFALDGPRRAATDARCVARGAPPCAADGTLTLERTVVVGEDGRARSFCRVNGAPASLRTTAGTTTSLATVADAPRAAAAAATADARARTVDRAAPTTAARTGERATRRALRRARRARVETERERREAIGVAHDYDEDEEGQLRYWVEELDKLEERVETVRTNVVEGWGDDDDDDDPSLRDVVCRLRYVRWESDDDDVLHDALWDLRRLLVASRQAATDARVAQDAVESDAAAALDRARSALRDLDQRSPRVVERVHSLLNDAETAVRAVADAVADDLTPALEATRRRVRADDDDLDALLADWGAAARRHGTRRETLPRAHRRLRRVANDDASLRERLREAEEREERAEAAHRTARAALTEERRNTCRRLSEEVTRRLPALGFPDEARFEARATDDGDDDVVEFFLSSDGAPPVVPLERAASSGERVRVLLALETVAPGSIGACCRSPGTDDDDDDEEDDDGSFSDPVVVLYDEIDAHVGGRAAAAVARALRARATNGPRAVAITHAAATAAAADAHFAVERGRPPRLLRSDDERAAELARMASGDAAPDEARGLAEALLRESAPWRETRAP